MEAWRVWIAAHGESVHLPELRRVMAARNESWYEIVERALEGFVPPNRRAKVPYAWQLDALMNGLVILAITTEASISFSDIEDVVVTSALAQVRNGANGKAGSDGAAAGGRRRKTTA